MLDRVDRRGDPLLGHDEVFGRINEQLFFLADRFAAGGIDDREFLDFVTPKLDPQGESGQVRTITFGPGGMVAHSPPIPPT